MKRKLIILLTFIIIFSLFIASCSINSEDSNDQHSMEVVPNERSGDIVTEEYDMATEDLDISGGIQPEKVITTIDLGLETVDFDEFTSDIEELTGENDGYIEYSNVWYGGPERSFRRGDYVIRVPRENINRFKDNVKDIANLLNESTNRQDVTTQYSDTESRLRVVETKEERILELLETADVMADIIELERELNNIIYEKEHLTSQLMDLDDRIDYISITLSVEEVVRYSNTEDIDTGLGTRIKNAFEDSIHFFYNSLETLVIFFIYLIPFLIIIVILVFFGRKFYNRYKKK